MTEEQNKDMQALFIDKFEKLLSVQAEFAGSKMPKEIAHEHINHHRRNSPPGTLKSVWLDTELIRFIADNADRLNFSGLRVYIAKYKGGVDPVPGTPHLKDKATVIIAPTMGGIVGDTDVAYFNYGRPCPPSCNGDEGE